MFSHYERASFFDISVHFLKKYLGNGLSDTFGRSLAHSSSFSSLEVSASEEVNRESSTAEVR